MNEQEAQISKRYFIMGYSCTTYADNVLKVIEEYCLQTKGSSNSWEHRGKVYFYEVGKEQFDGSIRGSVHRITPDGYARRVGSFRIEKNGEVTKFPNLPKEAKVRVNNESLVQQQFYCGESFVVI